MLGVMAAAGDWTAVEQRLLEEALVQHSGIANAKEKWKAVSQVVGTRGAKSCAAESCAAESCGAESCAAESCGAESCGAESCGAEACGAAESCAAESCGGRSSALKSRP